MSEPLTKRIKRGARFWLIQRVLWFVRVLPLGWSRGLGRLLGRAGFLLAAKERAKALASLDTAFPERPLEEKRAIARGCFEHFGQAAVEAACIEKLARDLDGWVEWPDADRAAFATARARGKGVIYVTAHLGNWELMGWRLAREFPFWAIGKPLTDARLQTLVSQVRERGGVHSIWRSAAGSGRQILTALKKNEVFCLLIDQDTRVQNLFVPFFGKLAATPRGAADLALRTGAAVVVGYNFRLPSGRYRMRTYELPVGLSGDDEADALNLTERLSLEIEKAVRQVPEQWVWMHQRWKTRPC